MNRRMLQAGPLSAIFENGGLRYIRWGELEVVRGVYAAVRDENWGTVTAEIEGLQIREDEESFLLSFRAFHSQGDIRFEWAGEIEGTAKGTLRFTMDGTAKSDFRKNRIGFCVLHPMELAGKPMSADTEEGEVRTRFPVAISPHQPLYGIRSLTMSPAPDVTVKLAFEGDAFEMEDQRNWTDASYKTYCTPLANPFPVLVRTGERMAQVVTLSVEGPVGRTAVESAAGLRYAGDIYGKLPRLGLGWADLGRGLFDSEVEALKHLSLSHVRMELRLADTGWIERFERAVLDIRRLKVNLAVDVVAESSDLPALKSLFHLIRSLEAPVDELFLFHPNSQVTESEAWEKARRWRDSLGLGSIRLGGGTRAYYAEFNRADSLRADRLEALTYSICPQVHAFDSLSLMETLGAQTITVRDAQARAPGVPVHAGPVTFRQRFNPVATSGIPLTVEQRYDSRQHEPFGAAWVLGSIAATSRGGAHAVTYMETIGPLGVFDENAQSHSPIYHLLRELAGWQGAECLVTEGGPPGLAALALRLGDKRRLILANTGNAPLTLNPGKRVMGPYEVFILDDNDQLPYLEGGLLP